MTRHEAAQRLVMLEGLSKALREAIAAETALEGPGSVERWAFIAGLRVAVEGLEQARAAVARADLRAALFRRTPKG